MQLRHGNFRRAGGYYCINRNCPESELFHYKNARVKVFSAVWRAKKVKVGLGIDD